LFFEIFFGLSNGFYDGLDFGSVQFFWFGYFIFLTKLVRFG
jgi:hypothetical protein